MSLVYNVLDHGLVELVDSMGSDLRIVNAAQASFGRESVTFGEREQRILRALMREEHGVPFEHAVFTYKARMPIFLARQFVKHRHGSWSEHSGRYSGMEKLFYEPTTEDVRTQVGKAMDYTFAPVEESTAALYKASLRVSNEQAWSAYEDALKAGVAKELARLVLPLNTYTTVVWTLNARSLFNVIRLRVDAHAQREANAYAVALEGLASAVIPETIAAFRDYERPKV